jgi:hypothetical protein
VGTNTEGQDISAPANPFVISTINNIVLHGAYYI